MSKLPTYGLIFIFSISLSWTPECCERKQVGEHFYNFKENAEVFPTECISNCVYTMDGDKDVNNRYCFKPGDLETVCEEKNRSYQCDRDCLTSQPYTCVFDLTLETLKTDANGRRADGRLRSILAFNRTNPGYEGVTMPGPPIVICEGDTLVVNFINNISGKMTNIDGSTNTTTLHFHGIREIGRPWSDGVPYVSQCPLHPKESFKYGFNTDINGAPAGTYWYHSHVGSQRTNGAYGALIIKENKTDDRYNVDNANNTLVIQEWYESATNQTPVSILINGQGRVGEQKLAGSDEEILKHLQGKGGTFQYVMNEDYVGPDNFKTSYPEFTVEKGKRYRFRIISTISQNLPLRLSIDDHRFTAISTDSRDIESVPNLTDLWVAAAERFNIVVETKTGEVPPMAYKIRIFGYSIPGDTSSPPLCSIAWLKYPGQDINKTYVTPYDCAGFQNLPPKPRTINPIPNNLTNFENRLKYPTWKDTTSTGEIFILDLRETGEQTDTANMENKIGHTKYYEFNGTKTFNGQRMTYPDIPFLLQNPQLNDDRCSLNRSAPLCQNVIELPWIGDRSQWAEIVLINSGGDAAAHPIHQHGGWYWVVGMGKYKEGSISRKIIIKKDKNENTLPRNFTNPPAKDVLQIPQNGYAILRIPLDNAGVWIFHCHINFHVQIGMATVQQIGKFNDWKPIFPLIQNTKCKPPPPSPLAAGGKQFISWFFDMPQPHPNRCVKPGEIVTFEFIAIHTVNVLSKQDWDRCFLNRTYQAFPHENIKVHTEVGNGYQDFSTTVPGLYHFACGLGLNKATGIGYHCEKAGMKATVTVNEYCY